MDIDAAYAPPLTVSLEVLDGSLMSLGLLPGAERSQVATLPGPWVPRSRINSILSGLEFSDHDCLQFSSRTGIGGTGFGSFAMNSSATNLCQEPSVSPDWSVAPSVFTWVSLETTSASAEPELSSLE